MDKQALVKTALHETEVDTLETVGEHRRIVMIDDCDEVIDSVNPLLGLTTHGHVGEDGEVLYVRLDVVQILVSHVADSAYAAGSAGYASASKRAEAAEDRAKEAEARAARLRKSLDDVAYAIAENALRGEGEHAGAVCKRAIEADVAREAPRG